MSCSVSQADDGGHEPEQASQRRAFVQAMPHSTALRGGGHSRSEGVLKIPVAVRKATYTK